MAIIDRLERDTGLPVLTSTQFSVWAALKTIGYAGKVEGYGRLLAERGGLLPSFPLEGPYRMAWAMRATRGMRERFDGVAESGESTTDAGCGRLMLHAVDATAG